jgi:predicted nucleic acid-binding protein
MPTRVSSRATVPSLDALIFVDTNILLDFYRIRKSSGGLELLEKLELHKGLVIIGSQVEMEYKKNRQKVILEGLAAQKMPDWSGLSAPLFLSAAKPYKAMTTAKKTIESQLKKARARIANILGNPARNDPVYKILQRIFTYDSPYNLNHDHKLRFKIHNLARKRFILGYPPRKRDDVTIGDAVNWEWIVHTALESGKHVILVSRDSDYGLHDSTGSYLNDWLLQEFRERVARTRQIVFTDSLAAAFKLVSITVSKAAQVEERELISSATWRLARSIRSRLMSEPDAACALCGETNKSILEVAHIVPVHLGGSFDESNLEILCPNCNRAKR